MVPTIGTTTFQLQIDEVTTEVAAVVVADSVQNIAVLVGQTFTEQNGAEPTKSDSELTFNWCKGGNEKILAPEMEEFVNLIQAPTSFDMNNLHVEGITPEVQAHLKN